MVLFTLLVCLCIAQMLFLGIKLRTQENIQVRHSQGAGDIPTKPAKAGTDGEGGSEYEPRENGRIGGEVKKPKNVGKGCVWKDIQVQNHGVRGGKRRKYNSAAKHTREVR